MSDSNNDMSSIASFPIRRSSLPSNHLSDHDVLNLSNEEKRVFAFLFDLADTDKIGVVTGERAVSFFEPTRVQPQVLGEIWQIADTENRGFLSKPGFCIVLRLIGHFQAGRQPTSELAFKSGPIPRFLGLQIPGPAAPTSPSQAGFPANALVAQNSGQGIRIPPLDPQKVAQYSGLFDRSGAQNGLLDGQTAKAIFEKAGLPVDVLGKIWTLSDREQRGALNQTEFIVAMHLLTSVKSKAMTVVPNTLPQGFYDAAARRGAPPPPPQARQPTAVARQFTGNSIGAPVRTSSPLARPAGLGTPPPNAPAWLISPQEKAKYDQFFTNLDPQGRGVLSGEQAAAFFGDSGLNEDTLASIWDLADINSEGQLTRDEFAVAMFLIKQQRSAAPAPLPAFLPPTLIPPSMRKPNLQQQTQQTTAPSFELPSKPKSAADDLFGLDEPAVPAQAPSASQPRDPFAADVPGSPASPGRFQSPVQAVNTSFKPFMPTSAFGASLTSQSTGPQQASARAGPSSMDDLLGDDAAESNKVTNDSTELANMSSQIGNLRSQMEDTQTKKATVQSDLGATTAQKRELETRLAQFRAQYEQEVRIVKDLEQQLAQSRESTKKLGQELAMLEGGYQDLQTQHQSIAQALHSDQTENANLKQRISELNAEVARLKPEIEKMKLDARQHKGLVSINKKQVSTNEAERDRLNIEKSELEREAAAAAASAQARIASPEPIPATRDISNPAGSAISSSTNPFFRSASTEAIKSAGTSAPNQTAFDQLFGPSFAESSRSPPPATSFQKSHNPGLAESMSSDGKLTPAATPPAETRDLSVISEPPPPPLSRQFTPDQLPVGGIVDKSAGDQEETASTSVIPPASRAGELSELGSERALTPAAIGDSVPGAFPDESGPPTGSADKAASDFDSAFAGFASNGSTAQHGNAFDSAFPEVSDGAAEPFTSFQPQSKYAGHNSEFPPIQSLEHEDEDSDSDDEVVSGHQTTNTAEPVVGAVPPASAAAKDLPQPPNITAQASPPSYEATPNGDSESTAFPREFTGLLPAREDPTSLPAHPENGISEPSTPKAVPQAQPVFPTTNDPVSATTTVATDELFHEASSRPMSEFTDAPETTAPKNAFDEFDDFEDLAEAQEADPSASSFDFGFGHSRGPSEFDSAFDSPAASTTDTTRTNTAASGVFGSSTNGASNSPFATGVSTSSIQHTPETKHDWDAIFSGLDNSATGDFETVPANNDPWETTPSTSTGKATTTLPATSSFAKGAITPGDEQDDPILKRLTGMGYSRTTALTALETYDYDINRAIDHLSSK